MGMKAELNFRGGTPGLRTAGKESQVGDVTDFVSAVSDYLQNTPQEALSMVLEAQTNVNRDIRRATGESTAVIPPSVLVHIKLMELAMVSAHAQFEFRLVIDQIIEGFPFYYDLANRRIEASGETFEDRAQTSGILLPVGPNGGLVS